MRQFIKNLFFTLVRVPLARNRASILMYHSISEGPDYFACVRPAEFERQLSYLAEKNIPVLSLGELVRRLTAGEPLDGAVVITFDDGYRNNYTAAFPALKKHRFPATIFVITNCIGKKDARELEHLSIAEMKEMEESKLISIEPHTVSHPKLAKLSSSDAREEIGQSKSEIERLLGKSATLFAYPYGNFGDETIAAVKECGLVCAVTAEGGTVSRGSDIFQLPRNSIDSSTTFAQFKGKISRAVDLYGMFRF